MELFDWSVVLYCEESVLCGLGLDQSRDWRSFVSSAVEPVGEMCRVIVDVEKIGCARFRKTLFNVGILREASRDCIVKGAAYCYLNFLRECFDVFGGFQCGHCVPGSIEDQTDEKKCTVVYEWGEWDDSNRVTVINSEQWMERNDTRKCIETVGGSDVENRNCVGEASRFAIAYSKWAKPVNWEGAIDRCDRIGGKLFNGEATEKNLVAEIDEICQQFNTKFFWSSIYSNPNTDKWINFLTGEEVKTRITIWGDQEPNNDKNEGRAVKINCKYHIFHDVIMPGGYSVVCSHNTTKYQSERDQIPQQYGPVPNDSAF